jgi:hypothetical protein
MLSRNRAPRHSSLPARRIDATRRQCLGYSKTRPRFWRS